MGCGGMCERLEGLCAFSALRAAFLLPWLLSSEGQEAMEKLVSSFTLVSY